MTTSAAIRGFALAVLCTAAIPVAAQETGDLDRIRQQALDLVNGARSEAGLSDLSLGPILNDAAQGHAIDMVGRDYYAHVAPDGENPRDRFRAAGGSRWALSGENIAKCSGCTPPSDIERVEAFHEGWMQSPEHRANILAEDFDRFGFGIAGEADEIYAVQTFAGPGAASEASALDAADARTAALNEINARRDDAGLEPLDASNPLDAVAQTVLEIRLGGEELPGNIFGLLPEGSTGWTSLSLLSASQGGSGPVLSRETITGFVETWAGEGSDASLGGADAKHLGFAASALENGRATAVAIFGGRD